MNTPSFVSVFVRRCSSLVAICFAPRRRKIALALQGGGSHGALAWGILDRLLEDPTIDIIGAKGTSAGAMNGTVLADGMVRRQRCGKISDFFVISERFVRSYRAGVLFTRTVVHDLLVVVANDETSADFSLGMNKDRK